MAKIASELQNQMNVLSNQEPIPVIVRRKVGVFSAQAIPGSPEVDCRFKLFPGEAVKITAADIDALSKHEDVEEIWPDLPVQTWLNSSVPKIATPRVWETGLKGKGIKVAVVDTGIDENHPDFEGRIVATASFVSDSAHDDNGHGTHVAGTVLGSGAKSNGKYVGVAPEASLYVAKVLRADGGGSMSGVMAGIEWAVLEQNVQIINLSLGGVGSCDGTDALSALCDEAVTQAGVVMCVAAGNTGPNAKTVGPPGCARYVITVGAITDSDQIARFSSRGPTSDGRIKPDIVYPGVDIIAPQAVGTQMGRVVEDGYVSAQGTSMATPHASGVAALMLEANPNLTAEQVKTHMLAGAVNLGAQPNEQGVGRGDAYQAYLKASDDNIPEPPPPPPPPPQSAAPPGRRTRPGS
ncbi:MAG: S8 family serine peptidase [Ketobacter sp.]|nr:S8 family serine peptidase [Ketobacter sp.]